MEEERWQRIQISSWEKGKSPFIERQKGKKYEFESKKNKSDKWKTMRPW